MDNQSMMNNVNKLAASDIPEWPNMTQIINAAIAVCQGKKSRDQAVYEILGEYKNAAAFRIENGIRQRFDDMIRNSPNEGVRGLSEKDFTDRLVMCTKTIAENVHRLYRLEISPEQFMDSLINKDLKKVANDALEALGVPKALGKEDADSIWLMSSDEVAYAALTEVYKELRKALEDAEIAHERRLKIEAECRETVACITSYRIEMEQVVSKYLKVRYETFEAGFAAMDRAIMENDIDGYLGGNAEIQKVLGYRVQFSNMEEFEDLMLSDEAFKL